MRQCSEMYYLLFQGMGVLGVSAVPHAAMNQTQTA